MMLLLAAVFALGFVAGLRTLLAPAALLLVRGGIAGYVVAVASLAELGIDLHPQAQSRTRPIALAGRLISGGITGWLFCLFVPDATHANGATLLHVAPFACVAVGIVGALAGAFGGKAARLWLIARIGRVQAAVLEDVVAIAIAWIALALAGPR
jgi:uncharacterized membrane protein